MIFEFKNEIYKRIRLDFEEIKPSNERSFVPDGDKDNTKLTLIDAVSFSHSSCFWSDFFDHTTTPYETNLSLDAVVKIFSDLAISGRRRVSLWDGVEVIEVDQNLEDFIKENLIVDKRK